MNKVELTLRVFEQKKNTNSVTMRCGLSGKKKEDGTYGKSMPVEVIVLEKTKWAHEDLTNKLVDVTGSIMVEDWEKNGKSGFNVKVFADTVDEFHKE
ncbi:MAG: hypothetical protein K6F41_05450 [Lachnospira sp.]|nr:hypothetical protein [Lachnospira sp.]